MANLDIGVDAVLQNALKNRIERQQSTPETQARKARSRLANIEGDSPLEIHLSSLKAIGQGIFGGQARKDLQAQYDQDALLENQKQALAQEEGIVNLAGRIASNERQDASAARQDADLAMRQERLGFDRTKFEQQQKDDAILKAQGKAGAEAELGILQFGEDLKTTLDTQMGTYRELEKLGAVQWDGTGYVPTDKITDEQKALLKDLPDPEKLIQDYRTNIKKTIAESRLDDDEGNDLANTLVARAESAITGATTPSQTEINAADAAANAIESEYQKERERIQGTASPTARTFASNYDTIQNDPSAVPDDVVDQVITGNPSLSKDYKGVKDEVNKSIKALEKNEDFAALSPAWQRQLVAQGLQGMTLNTLLTHIDNAELERNVTNLMVDLQKGKLISEEDKQLTEKRDAALLSLEGKRNLRKGIGLKLKEL